jgi:hypothetical protein
VTTDASFCASRAVAGIRDSAQNGRDPFDPEVKFELRIAFGLLELFESLGVELLPALGSS